MSITLLEFGPRLTWFLRQAVVSGFVAAVTELNTRRRMSQSTVCSLSVEPMQAGTRRLAHEALAKELSILPRTMLACTVDTLDTFSQGILALITNVLPLTERHEGAHLFSILSQLFDDPLPLHALGHHHILHEGVLLEEFGLDYRIVLVQSLILNFLK